LGKNFCGGFIEYVAPQPYGGVDATILF